MAEQNTANIGFEKQIWDAACVLRGNMNASEYAQVVLGLIFLKYVSDVFEQRHIELVAEGEGFEEDTDEYTSKGIFFVPVEARWDRISTSAHTEEVGTAIDDAMRSIEKANRRLKDILPKNFARPELDKRRLGEVVDLFTNIHMMDHGTEKDILGRTYEYCLSHFAEQEGKPGQQQPGRRRPLAQKARPLVAQWLREEARAQEGRVRHVLRHRNGSHLHSNEVLGIGPAPFPQQVRVPRGHGLHGEHGCNPRAGIFHKAGAEFPVIQQPQDLARKLVGLIARGHEAGHAIQHDLGQAAHIRHHAGGSGHCRFQRRQPEGFKGLRTTDQHIGFDAGTIDHVPQ